MNDVTLSGIISTNFEEYGNDGILFQTSVSSPGYAGKERQVDDFVCLAYGNAAQLLRQRGKSGQRIIFQGRLGSEKLGTDKYHSALTVARILGLTDAENGTDTAHIVVSGASEVQDIRYVGSKDTPLVPIRMTNMRYFKKDNEVLEYRTYVGASVWGDKARTLNETTSGEDIPIIIYGFLKPRSYQDRDGDDIGKIDVWVQEVFGGEDLTPFDQTPSDSQPITSGDTQKEDTPPPASKPRRASRIDDDPF